MLSELHLKFHSETGTYPTPRELFDEDENPIYVVSDEYLEWLEDLALKQLKSVKVNADAVKVMAKFAEIKSCFENLHSEINSIDVDDVERYEIESIIESCDALESVIYD